MQGLDYLLTGFLLCNPLVLEVYDNKLATCQYGLHQSSHLYCGHSAIPGHV